MKRKCKNVDITNKELIIKCIKKCFKNKRKTRKDYLKLMSSYGTLENLADQLQIEIMNKKIILKPIWYRYKTDVSSGKKRRIGIQDIKQQIYDYIVVEGLDEALRTIGPFQFSALENRGQIYGARVLHNWLKNPDIKYACQLDIRKCYENIKQDKLMDYLKKRVKNDDLLWLVDELLSTFDDGLAIGSYMSQHLSNLYLSDLYHEISQKMVRTRRKKNGEIVKIPLVKHVGFYADDITILGTNSKDLMNAVKLIKAKSNEMGLGIKENWRLYKTNDFIDMMGFRIYDDHIALRRRVFIRGRRAFARFAKNQTSVKLAQRVISYHGLFKNTNSVKVRKKYKIDALHNRARKVISNKSKIRYTTTKSENSSNE